MTVRSWITISVVVLVALGAAAATRVLSPIPAPDILVSVDKTRLRGVETSSCWPQRDGRLRCRRNPGARPSVGRLPASGRMRIIAAYPVQPTTGRILIRGPQTIERTWTDRLDYELEPGTYSMEAHAGYGKDATTIWKFRFEVGPTRR